MSLADLLRARTVAAIAAILDERAGEQAAAASRQPDSPPAAPARPPIRPGRRDQPIPLSLEQERIWFFEQLSPGNLAYNIQVTVSLHGEVRTEALRAALDEIVRRHEILRTAFVTVDGVPMQRPLATARAPLRVLDVPAEDAEEAIDAELGTPFDLTRPPLARWLLLRHSGDENTLVHVEHHIVHDGWSMGVLLSELSVLYQAFATGKPSPLPDLPVGYADYALWQREWMRGEVLRAHVDHWTGLLAGAPDILELPADHPRPPVMSFRGAAPPIKVPLELSRALRSFSREHRVSLFSTMYAGFAALLYRYTGQQDVLVGTGAANRSLPELRAAARHARQHPGSAYQGQRPDVVHRSARSGTADRHRRTGLVRRPDGRRHRRDRADPRPLAHSRVPGHVHLPRLRHARRGLRRAGRRRHRARERVGQGRPQRDRSAAGLAAAGPGAPARGRRPEPDLGVLDRPVR